MRFKIDEAEHRDRIAKVRQELDRKNADALILSGRKTD